MPITHTFALGLLLAMLAGSAVLIPGREEHHRVDATALASAPTGDLTILNSRAGLPVLSAVNLAPGDSAGGSVAITNAGTIGGLFTLERRDVTDTPGPAGGKLSERLRLRVSQPGVRDALYDGPLASMGPRPLGWIGAGESRTYLFEASFPDGGPAVSNPFAGSSAGVGFVWTAHSADPPGDGEPGQRAPAPLLPRPGAGSSQGTSHAALAARVPRRQRALRHRRLAVRVRCRGGCLLSGRAAITAGGRYLGLLRGPGRRRLPGRAVTLGLRIPRATLRRALRAAARGEAVRVAISLRARFASGRREAVRVHARLSR